MTKFFKRTLKITPLIQKKMLMQTLVMQKQTHKLLKKISQKKISQRENIAEENIAEEDLSEQAIVEEEPVNEDSDVMLTDETVEENATEEVVDDATPAEDIMVEESITEKTVAEAPVEEEQAVATAQSSEATVYYVMDPMLDLKEQADPAAASVGSLSVGDPVLVTMQGEWAHVVGRGYVMAAA